MEIQFELLHEKDLPIIEKIYNYYIQNSTATFHAKKLTVSDLKTLLPFNHQKYATYMIKSGNEKCGFCYLSRYKPRQAYDRTAEVTIYLKPDYHGQGIGTRSLLFLEKVARENGISVLIGVITAENESSVRLFEKCGYEKCAHFKEVGEKFGRILDVVAYQKILDGNVKE